MVVLLSRDTFHFPWTRKFSFFSLSCSGLGQNTKNNGVLQGKFCIFTCPKDWHLSWKMNIRVSVQNLTILSPGSLLFNQQQTRFFFVCFSTMPNGNCKKFWFRAQNSVKNNFLLLCLETSLAGKFLFLCSSLKNHPWMFEKKIRFSTSCEHNELG